MAPDDQAGADVGSNLLVQSHLPKKTYVASAVSGCTLNGKTWCFPWALEEVGLYYNKHDVPASVFKGAYTWTSVAKWAKSYTASHPGHDSIAWAWENVYYNNDFLTAFGGGDIAHGSSGYIGKKVTVNSAATVKGLQALQSFITDSGPGCRHTSPTKVTDPLCLGQGCHRTDGPWSDAQWESAGMKKGVDYGFAPLPGFKVGKKVVYGKPFIGVQVIGVNKYSKHVKAALSLGAYLSTHMELPLYNASGRIPATISALKKVSSDAEIKEYSKAFAHAGRCLTFPRWVPCGVPCRALSP